ncbi:MAG: mechanosensitive ion channel protein MscS [Halomonadaceae bacterium]|nr:MAG: mechanosensitive ion channel protein MscS [Halomonadaceae bacterium]
MAENWQDLLTALQEIQLQDVFPQAAVLVVAAVVALYLHHLIGRLTAADSQGMRHLTQRTIQRITFPFSMLLVVLIGRVSLDALSQAYWLLDLAVPLLISFALVRTLVYMLRKGVQSGPLAKASENMISTTIWLVVGLHLLGWLPGLLEAMEGMAIDFGAVRVSLLAVVKLLLLLGFMLLVAIWLSGIIDRRVSQLPYLSAGAAVGFSKVSKLVLITIALLLVLNLVGIDLTTLAVFGGALGVGLGFGLQRIASNFISGFILIFDRSIRPGDIISVGSKFGWVEALHARYVVVRNRDGVDTLIPNENLITTEVINWSYSDPNVRLKVPVSVSYGDDVERAMEIMLEIVREHPRVLAEPAPSCRLIEFGDHGIHLEARVWVADPAAGFGGVRSDINLGIWRRFKTEGITIPFPQQDIYIKEVPPKPE